MITVGAMCVQLLGDVATSLGNAIVAPGEAVDRREYSAAMVWTLVLVMMVGTASQLSWLMYSDAGRKAYRERQVAVYQTVRDRLGEAQYRQFLEVGQREVDRAWYRLGISKLISTGALLLGAALLIYYVVPPISGRVVPYRSILGMVSLAAVVFVIETAFTSLLTYATGTLKLAGNFEALVPLRLPAIFAAINPFVVWWIALVSRGMGTLCDVRPRSSLITLLGLYAVYVVAVSLSGRPDVPGVPRFHGT